MKSVFIGLVALYLLSCSPRVPLAFYNYPKPFEFVLIDSLKGTKDEIYVKANEWMAKAFVSSKAVIQMQDKEVGKLIGKANFQISYGRGSYMHHDHVNFTISIDVRDGKYRCMISDFYHEFDNSAFQESGFGWLESPEIHIHGIDRTKELAIVKNQTMDKSRELLQSLKAKMSAKKDDF